MEQTITELLDAQQMAAAKAIAEREEALQISADRVIVRVCRVKQLDEEVAPEIV